MSTRPVRRALVSVYDKTGLDELARGLADAGVEIVSTGSTAARIAGLDRAAAAGLPSFVVPIADHADRAAWDVALADAVAVHQPDWVVCAGFMRILGAGFLERFPERVINTHPALLPSFPGAHGVRDTLAYGVKVTGCTVHLVDSGVDTGPVLAQGTVPVEPYDDETTLHDRIKTVERSLLVGTVAALAVHGCTVTGRKASIP